ncbi:MAG: glycosyltransferase [Bauldia sp.]|nr:glycosyltransferase [Bauldia sp.]
MGPEIIAIGLAAVCLFVHVGSVVVVVVRLGRHDPEPPASFRPKVSLVRPVCGLEHRIEDELASSFALSWPNLEIVFCVEEEDDPAVAVVRRLIAAHPAADARLVVGRDVVGANPKLNNVIKGWYASTGDFVIISDSNALLPRTYVEDLLSRWQDDTGVASHAALMVDPRSFAAEVECAFLNSYQGRWALAGDSIGRRYALGKTLMWERRTLDALGGPAILAREAAEDIASTKVLRGTGLRPRLARRPLPQPIGSRSLSTVWRRQVRWARLRRAGLGGVYGVEALSGAAIPFACAASLAIAGIVPWLFVLAYAGVWYGAEATLTAIGRWPLSWRMPLAWIVRDAVAPVLWLLGWGNRFEWRGVQMSVRSLQGPVPGSAPNPGEQAASRG